MTDHKIVIAKGHRRYIRNGPTPKGGWKTETPLRIENGDTVTVTTGVAPPPPPPPGPNDRTVPASIDATGATDVTAALNQWIAAQPNGSRLIFPAGAIYRLSEGVQLAARTQMTLVGNGATLRIPTAAGFGQLQSLIVLGHTYGGYWTGGNRDIVISGFTLEGGNPTPGRFDWDRQHQAGLEIENSAGVEVFDMTIRGVGGDAIKVGGSTDVLVHGIHSTDTGRNGLTVISGQRITMENSTFDDIGYYVLDVEPNNDTQGVDGVMFRSNTSASYGPNVGYGAGFVAVGSGKAYLDIRNVTVIGNRMTGTTNATLETFVNQNQHRRLTNIVISSNSSVQSGGVIELKSVDSGDVRGNTSGGAASIVRLIDCNGVML